MTQSDRPAPQPDGSPTWRIIGASVVGTGHLKEGKKCEDAHLTSQTPQGALLVAIADGASSASRGAEGAQQAVSAAMRAMTDRLRYRLPEAEAEWHELLSASLQAARTAVETLLDTSSTQLAPPAPPGEEPIATNASADAPLKLRDFASTVQLAVVLGAWVAAVQIGDGAVIAALPDGTFDAITWPKHGEYINETDFLTGRDYLRDAQFSIRRQEVRGLACMSDGLETITLDFQRHQPHPPFFERIFAFARHPQATAEVLRGELEHYLDSPDIRARTDDDKTLVLAVRE